MAPGTDMQLEIDKSGNMRDKMQILANNLWRIIFSSSFMYNKYIANLFHRSIKNRAHCIFANQIKNCYNAGIGSMAVPTLKNTQKRKNDHADAYIRK
jgi:hypothetical protein